jgi:Tol biopolymer transport system component
MSLPPRHIVRIPGPAAERRDPVAEVLIASRGDSNAAFSPDGRRIAFESGRSGRGNIWVCDRDGFHPVQLTNLQRGGGTPRWSPDGRWITFDSAEAGDWNVYVTDPDGRRTRRLTPETSTDVRGVWSRDGRWVFFVSDRGGTRQIWRVPAEGGPAVQVTRGGAAYAEASWDGQHLYYANAEFLPSIWRVPVGGGEETEVIRGPLPHALDWALSAPSLVFATTEERARESEAYTVHSLDLESGEVTELFRREGPFHHETLAVSPDGEWVLFGENRLGDDELTLVEGFR